MPQQLYVSDNQGFLSSEGKCGKAQALIGLTPEFCLFVGGGTFFCCLGIGDHLGLDDLCPRAVIGRLHGGPHGSPLLVLSRCVTSFT